MENDHLNDIYQLNNLSQLEWLKKAPINSVTSELLKRKLKVEGSLTQLKDRLSRYFAGDWHPNDFSVNIETTKKNMNDKTPFCKPGNFSGAINESVDLFLNKYNRAAKINAWTEPQKRSFLAIYLSDTALTFFENLEQNNELTNWTQIEEALRLEFEPTAQSHLLRIMIDKRKQLCDEPVSSYINEIESLCKRIDAKMSQSELVHTIMKGLKPQIVRYVGILDNKNLQELKQNIRKYESIQFMIGDDNEIQSPHDIKTQITKEHLYNIQDTKTQKQIEIIAQQISKIENFLYNSKPLQNNEWTQTHNNNNFNRNNRTTNRNDKTSTPKNNNSQVNNEKNTTKCNHCNFTNHSTDNCRWILQCDFCNKRYHTAETCYLKINESKNSNTG